MIKNAADMLASYVEALRPIIYINHFDFDAIDRLISEIGNDVKIFEYNHANKYCDFKTKNQNQDYSLSNFLSLMEASETGKYFIVLKDIHNDLENPEIIAKLKSIALKMLYKEDFYITIFIVSTKLVVPQELEKLITIFDIPYPEHNEILSIINNYAKDMEIKIEEDIIYELATLFKGFSDFEIRQILNLAYQNSGSIDRDDLDLILKEKEQIIKKSAMLEIIASKESTEDIGGLQTLKDYLSKKEKIFKDLGKAKKFGVDLPKGILIVGMPGCGKSLTAKAAAVLFDVPLLRLDIGKLMGKYVGESEDNLRRSIKTAEAVSPCVLWIDELEKAFAGIGGVGGGSDITTRLFGNFLTWLQEKQSSVYVIATSNDISKLPPEFLRKGRFDELFFVKMPNGEERKKIFEIHFNKRGKLNLNIDTIKLIKETEGYSGADIEAVVKESIENAFIKNDNISTEKILEIIKKTKSISVTLKDKIKEIDENLKKFDMKEAS